MIGKETIGYSITNKYIVQHEIFLIGIGHVKGICVDSEEMRWLGRGIVRVKKLQERSN